MSDVETTGHGHLEWRTSFRTGLFGWPAQRREIELACVTAGISRRDIRARWRGFGVHVDVTIAGDERRVRRVARFVDDLAAQLSS